MNKELEKKVEQAVKLLQVCYKAAGEPLEVAYSGREDIRALQRYGYSRCEDVCSAEGIAGMLAQCRRAALLYAKGEDKKKTNN